MSTQNFKSFEDFWPFYVREHSQFATRVFHFVGTSFGLFFLAATIFTGNLWFLLVGLVVSYAFAWTSHFFIEKNRPATFKHPFYSFLADFKIYALMWRGQMGEEVTKATNQTA